MRKPTVDTESVAQDQLRAFFERLERMAEERKAIGDDIKEIYAEAKANGFDTKVMKIILQKRRMDHNDRLEQEALVELYMAALNMTSGTADDEGDDEPPRGRAPAPARMSANVVPIRKSEPALTAAATGADKPDAHAEQFAPVTESTAENVGGSAGRLHSSQQLPTGSTASVSAVDTIPQPGIEPVGGELGQAPAAQFRVTAGGKSIPHRGEISAA